MGLTNYSGLQVYKYSPGDVFASACLTEKCVEGVIASSNGLVTRHLAIRLDAMFQTVQLPACIANLDTSLSQMDRNTLTLKRKM